MRIPRFLLSKLAKRANDLVFRRASHARRIELCSGDCTTLFVTGPVMRGWGFHCPKSGWVHWRAFTNPLDGGATVGRGCGEEDAAS